MDFSRGQSDRHVTLCTRPHLRIRGTTLPTGQHTGNLLFALPYTDTDSTLALACAERAFFVTSHRCLPFKNTMGWSAVVFCVSKIIQLLAIVICVVRDVHKFDFWLVINVTPNKWRQVKSPCSDKDWGFWQDLYVLHWPPLVLRDSTHAGQINCIFLSRRQYWSAVLAFIPLSQETLISYVSLVPLCAKIPERFEG